MDLTPLLRREVLKERGHPAAATYRLWFLAHSRIARKWAGALKTLFYTSENQPWERMLCAAWKQNAPSVRLVGYQHATVCPLMLNYFLGAGESTRTPLPNRLLANGEAALSLLSQGGYPSGFLENGGALRFESLHRDLAALPAPAPRKSSGRVLVAFPFSRDYGMGLFRDIQDVLREPLILEGSQTPVIFVLKFHPWFPIEKFGGNPKDLPPWMTVSTEALGRALNDCDLMLYAPPTTSWAEAILSGIPAMKFRGDLLDIDFSESWKGVSVPVCTRETLKESVARELKAGVRPPVDREGLLESLFGRVREELWKKLAR